MYRLQTKNKYCPSKITRYTIGIKNSTTLTLGGLGFSEVIGLAVIGHYSLNGDLENQHFNFEGTIPNFFAIDKEEEHSPGIPSSVLEQVIQTLSFEGDWIIDATRDFGEQDAILNDMTPL